MNVEAVPRKDKIDHIISRAWMDQSYTEGNMGWHALWFGLFFLSHPDMYNGPYFSIMTPFILVGPPWLWGMWFTALGIIKIVTVYNGGRRGRRFSSALGFMSWGFLTFVLFQVSHQALGLSVFSWFTAVCGISYIRTGMRSNALTV